MSDSTTLDDQASALLRDQRRPRRRVRPRVARSLAEAQDYSVSTPFGDVAAWRLGEGPAVLLVHGWEDDNSLWGPAIDQFAAWGRSVAVLDLPGHGFSPAEDASIESVAAAVTETARALGPVVAAVGHSYGCAALIRAIMGGLALERLVLIASPVPRTHPRRPLQIEGAEPEVLARAEALRQQHTARQTAAVEATLTGLHIPLLAVHSIEDEQCAVGNSQRMVELAPNAELLLTDGLGHRFIAQEDDVLQRVVSFVEGM